MQDLEPGLLIPVNYIRAIDGDTIEVEIRRKFHVRLRDIDVYEKKDNKGKIATKFVRTVLANSDKDILVFIPTNSPDKLMDITSFERIIGDIYVDGQNLAHIMREKGFEKDV